VTVGTTKRIREEDTESCGKNNERETPSGGKMLTSKLRFRRNLYILKHFFDFNYLSLTVDQGQGILGLVNLYSGRNVVVSFRQNSQIQIEKV
jgi:hypothetical protein